MIAFGGRALRPDDEPKYLNSPETKIYKKSTVLYNLHRAKIDARKHDRMILVEGYMDVIGVYSAGIHEVVASSGTSLAIEQVRAIKRQVSQQQASTGQVILNFDPDAAGDAINREVHRHAAGRRTAREGAGDSGRARSRRIHPAERRRVRIEACSSGRLLIFIGWRIAPETKFDMRTAEGRVDAFKFLLPVLQQVNDRIERAAIANELAEYLNVDREVMHEQSATHLADSYAAQKPHDLSSAIPPNEKLLLAVCLRAPTPPVDQQYLRRADMLPILELRADFRSRAGT